MIKCYICDNVFVPLRAAPSHRSEMVSQVLFGEKYSVKSRSGNWINIETLFDNYEGWIDGDHLQHTTCNEEAESRVLSRALECYKEDRTKIILPPGSNIYDPDYLNRTFNVGLLRFSTSPEFSEEFTTPEGTVTDTAMGFLNSPYLWGGRVPSGIDCSGLVQLSYKIHGINLPRDSREQVGKGIKIDNIDDVLPGDLVFFNDDRGIICHVGMIISKGKVIHSSGRVRIDKIDNRGIFKRETGQYSHILSAIRRIEAG